MKSWIVENWQLLSVLLGSVIAVLIVIFVPKNWLLGAVIAAEKKYGDGYGELQKAEVYALLLKEFPEIGRAHV
jgi:hypothetical protein